jgi:hypothetical protein
MLEDAARGGDELADALLDMRHDGTFADWLAAVVDEYIIERARLAERIRKMEASA